MQKLKIDKGYSLIEAVISLALFSILFMTVISLSFSSIRIKNYTNSVKKHRFFLETLKNTLFYNTAYSELKSLQSVSLHYINRSNMEISSIKNGSISSLITSASGEKPYIYIRISGEEVLRVELELHYKIFNRDEMMGCEFYRGNYRE